MGIFAWLKGLVRQVVEDDLEGTGASRQVTPAKGRRLSAASPLVSEHDVGAQGGGVAGGQEPAAGAAGDEEDAEAAAAWVVYNDQNRGGDGRE